MALTDLVRPRPGALALGILLTWLAGCGPGVGGTGSGAEPPLVLFGAASSPVCASAIAPVLACPGTTGSAVQVGTGPVIYSGGTPLGRLRAAFEGQRLKAGIDCGAWQFEGEWGTDGQGRQRYFGTLVRGSAGAIEAAQFELRLLPGPALSVTVFDLQDRPLLGPVELRSDGATTPPACP